MECETVFFGTSHQYTNYCSTIYTYSTILLRSLDETKAMGYDGISPKLLKQCALSLYQPLHYLFSLSLSQSYLPLEWRTHLIKPIFKSGDKNSYRPISLLSVVSKVLERLVYNGMVDFIVFLVYFPSSI